MSPRDAVRGVIDKLGATWVDPPVLQPTALYLELSGDEIRRRAFLVDDEGGDLCLRPDMTVPAVRSAFAMKTPPAIVAYEGAVFRRAREETQFMQIGAEWIGSKAMSVEQEADVIAAALAACRAAGVEPRLRLGDVAVRDGFVAACGLDESWAARVRRALAGAHDLAALTAASAPQRDAEGLAEALAALSQDHAEAAVEDLLSLAGITAIEGRPVSEIASRLRSRGRLASAAPPSAAQTQLLAQLAALDGPNALDEAAALANNKALPQAKLAADAVVRAKARLEALKAHADLPAQTSFSPSLGRDVAFYDGFVFELEAKSGGVGGGGRYDALARALWPAERGAPGALSAAGFALGLKRLESAAS